jgi:RNA polymerase-binding transcription factor DksA
MGQDPAKQDIVARLQAELDEARAELRACEQEVTHPPEVELGGGSPGYSSWQAAVVLREHFERRIEELEDALTRAEAGLYGICEGCGQPIASERLEALPFTTTCIQCAEKGLG